MRTSRPLLLALLGSSIMLSTLAYAEEPVVQPAPPVMHDSDSSAQAQPAPQPHSYDVKEFYADSRHYTYGDVVPDLYRTKKYEIVEWQKRHLPPPETGSHWTYIGGNYVLISDGEGKFLKAESGEIFFQ